MCAVQLVQLLLPLYANDGARIPRAEFDRVREELTSRFGGLTAHSRAPAEGLWKDEPRDAPTRDEIVIYEVMVDALDRAWWEQYRRELERRFRQEQLVIRAQEITLL
jgi:hypothetical protein